MNNPNCLVSPLGHVASQLMEDKPVRVLNTIVMGATKDNVIPKVGNDWTQRLVKKDLTTQTKAIIISFINISNLTRFDHTQGLKVTHKSCHLTEDTETDTYFYY